MATSTYFGWTEPDDTDLVKNGAAAMRTLGNAIDSTLWTVGGYAAGKNKIINGDFRINQRNFTSTTSDGTFGFDRWVFSNTGISCTMTPQVFTPGAAPVTGYEAINYTRILTTGQTATTERTALQQRIEDVRNFANQTATVSFWAKAASGTPKVALEIRQDFGSGGSTAVLTYAGQVTLSTSWARYSISVAIPSISGKTVGTSSWLGVNIFVSAGSDFNARTGSLGIQSNTFDFWGVQAEAGSVATPFQTATGTIQGELAACQRYYWRSVSDGAYSVPAPSGFTDTTTNVILFAPLPVQMRVSPTSIEWNSLQYFDSSNVGATPSSITISTARTTNTILSLNATVVGATAGRFAYLRGNNTTAAYLAASAEL